MYEKERRSRRYYEGRARWYDWANRLAALLRGESATNERRKAVRRVNLKPGHRVLEVSVGTGTNLPLIAKEVGPHGRMVGVDISPAMLARCRRRLREHGLRADLVEGEAAHLPFRDDDFDAVLHHGGIAEFGDKRGAIEEMIRVAKPGAKVVICDLGVPTDRKLSLVNRLLLKLQPVYAQTPPVDLIPPAARDLHVSWFHGGAWYMIEFEKS
ncbi:MAG: class I SAM-dependent methyltransferase [Dehalococcoidia bacterium]|nr:class I SAM-dependent methyltransferase [Dehalococcoidia bacterium]